jgi:hypothetical protein
MDNTRTKMSPWQIAAVALLSSLTAVLVPAPSARAAGPARVASTSPVMWEWDDTTVIGHSQVIRSVRGLEARLVVSGLTPADTVTLWIAAFNNPSACSATPCARPADVGNPDTRADLFWADGVIVGAGGRAVFRGHVDVGDVEHSLKGEVGIVDPVPLEDPYTAEVALALHSHGPVQPGNVMAQLTSFLGGCEVLTGISGFAQGPEDMPDEVGECTTFAKSAHLPPAMP